MNIQKTFNYFNGRKFTVVVDNNHTNWYLGSDVAIILGYADASQAINNNCKNAITKSDLCNLISNSNIIMDLDFNYRPNTKFIPLLDVIPLADKCTKLNSDEITKFKTWLNDVVNPQISNDINKDASAKNAGFSSRAEEIISENTNALREILETSRRLEAELNRVRQEAISNKKEADLNAEKAEVYEGKANKFAKVVGRLAPKAKVYDQIAARKDSLTMEQTAKLISERFPHLPNANVIGRNILLRVLRAKGALTTKNIATQAMVSAGYFTLKYSTFEGETYPCSTLVTPKGVEYIINVAKEFGYLPDISCPDVEEARQWASMLQAIRPASTTI